MIKKVKIKRGVSLSFIKIHKEVENVGENDRKIVTQITQTFQGASPQRKMFSLPKFVLVQSTTIEGPFVRLFWTDYYLPLI